MALPRFVRGCTLPIIKKSTKLRRNNPHLADDRGAEIGYASLTSTRQRQFKGFFVRAILSAIENLEIDLAMMATTGEGCNLLMMGAIANRILREAQAPVIFVKKEPWYMVPHRSDLRGHAK